MENNKLPLIFAGVAVVIGGALMYHYIFSSEEEDKYDELYSELEKIKNVQRDASGSIVLDDFLKIFKIVTTYSKKEIVKFKTKNNEKRREHLRKGEEEEYKEWIKNQISKEESIYQEVALEVLNHLGIEEQDFMISQGTHQMDHRFQKLMMEMQLGMGDEPLTQPSVSKEKAKEIFMFVEEEKEKAMANMNGANSSDLSGMMGQLGDAGTINMIVEHSKVSDKLYEKYGIEEEEFAKYIQYYNLIQDPDIQKLVQKSIAKMGPEAIQMIAQMNGGAPGGTPSGMSGMGFG